MTTKKILAITLFITLLLGFVFSIKPVYATDKNASFKFALSNTKEKIHPGDTFEMTVKLTDLQNIEEGLVAIKGQLVYDETILELVPTTIHHQDGTSTQMDLVGQNNWSFEYNPENKEFVSDSRRTKTSSDLFKVLFKVKDTIEKNTDTEISIVGISGSEGTGIITVNNSEPLPVNVTIPVTEEITSDTYTIENSIISNIPANTTVEEVKKHIQKVENRELVFVDKEGKVLQNSDLVTTQTVLKVGQDYEYALCVTGDIDGDGKITINDLAKIKLHLIEKEILTGISYMAANVDGQDEVTINDLARIKLILIGKEIVQ